MNRNGELAIVDYPEGEKGRERERERYPVVYGAKGAGGYSTTFDFDEDVPLV